MLPDPSRAQPGVELLGVGADLEPGTLLAAYRRGLFPMPTDADGPLGWWSPDPRGILPLDGLRVTASLRKSCRRYTTTVDTAFVDVVRACGDPRRPGGWITPGIVEAYAELHRLGWAHSVETRTVEGDLVGGLYGVEIGGLFAGESMFSRATDASKVALVGLVERLAAAQVPGARRRLLDVQWRTDHLATLGVVEASRRRYLRLLRDALTLPPAF
ncbi:MAG: leucyl/phenylalanyl-tRNA--protein transferase [Actinomycetales bacterium]|nr:leucyl/phenylalanyl-tRNA--protein transferase [Actinomycetales bacterium]